MSLDDLADITMRVDASYVAAEITASQRRKMLADVRKEVENHRWTWDQLEQHIKLKQKKPAPLQDRQQLGLALQ